MDFKNKQVIFFNCVNLHIVVLMKVIQCLIIVELAKLLLRKDKTIRWQVLLKVGIVSLKLVKIDFIFLKVNR